MSRLNQHLRRRGAVYHYRRRLPSALKEILNETYFDGSLATADPVLARRLARRISVALDQLSEHLQGMPDALKPTPGQLNLVLKELFYSAIRDGDRRRELIGEGFNWLPAGNREAIMNDEADEETWQIAEVGCECVHHCFLPFDLLLFSDRRQGPYGSAASTRREAAEP